MVEVGPGSIRVGRFIGRLGVVTMPAIGYGLGLADRVVRRHVAKLEASGGVSGRRRSGATGPWCG